MFFLHISWLLSSLVVTNNKVCTTLNFFSAFVSHVATNTKKNEKALKRRKHCVPKNSTLCRPLPRGAGPLKFNLLEMATACTYRPSLVKIDTCDFELSR